SGGGARVGGMWWQVESSVVAQGLANRAGTRCEHVRVRSPSPSMAQDGPGPIGQTLCITSSAEFKLRTASSFLAPGTLSGAFGAVHGNGTVCGRDAAREPTGMYSRRVPLPCTAPKACPTRKAQRVTSNEQRATSNEQRATSNECEETTGQSRKQYASALPRTAYPMKHLPRPGQATSVLAPTPGHAATTATGAR